MRVFLTGSTGFVGGHVLKELLAQGHEIICLVREGSEHQLDLTQEDERRVTLVYGDVRFLSSIPGDAASGCDAAIHLVGIIRESPGRGVTFHSIHLQGTENVLTRVKESGCPRYLHMSALGSRPAAATLYHRTKYEAEEMVRASGLEFTIFRPSLIIGEDGEFIEMLMGMVKKRLVPLIGTGRSRFQPVAARNVAQGFAAALERHESVGKTYEVGGPDVLPYRKMLTILADVLGYRIFMMPQPVFLLWSMATLLDRFPFFPLTRDQITMFLEGSVCHDAASFYDDLELEPITYRDALLDFLG